MPIALVVHLINCERPTSENLCREQPTDIYASQFDLDEFSTNFLHPFIGAGWSLVTDQVYCPPHVSQFLEQPHSRRCATVLRAAGRLGQVLLDDPAERAFTCANVA